jgi:hypothetical protein
MVENRHQVSRNRTILIFALAAGLVYFFSNPHPQNHFDYTVRVAESLLNGRLGLVDKPPSWLNEFIPFGDEYYSVFPLGAVVTMVPVAILRGIGFISEMPSGAIAGFCAAICAGFLLLIGFRYELTPAKRIVLASSILFGTWMWVDLTMGGAWQLALGFAMVGELGAIYFALYDRRPLIAGVFFALAFGNRTEVLATAPIFFYLLSRPAIDSEVDENGRRSDIRGAIEFAVVPVVLGIATLFYNYERFGSAFDFGYARIPGVLYESWYDHGIFSLYYIPRQAYEMLFKLWRVISEFPYLIPDGFSSSIILSSPFLLLVFRPGSRNAVLRNCAWIAIAVLTLILWAHGNSGGWQFGYRYAMVLLPWVYVALLENGPKRLSATESATIGFSILANVYAVWLFHWTAYVKP